VKSASSQPRSASSLSGPYSCKGVVAVEKTPSEAAGSARLHAYWAHGPGAAKIGWSTAPGAGDYSRCVVLLGKYVPEHMVKGLCANLHKSATGRWPGENNE